MSLVNFKAQNHRQQVGSRGARQFFYVPNSWRLRVFKCCDYHSRSVQIGPLLWRRDV